MLMLKDGLAPTSVKHFSKKVNVNGTTFIPLIVFSKIEANYYYYYYYYYALILILFFILKLCSYNTVQQLPIARSTNKMQEKVIRLQNYVRDIHNFLLKSRVSFLAEGGKYFLLIEKFETFVTSTSKIFLL